MRALELCSRRSVLQYNSQLHLVTQGPRCCHCLQAAQVNSRRHAFGSRPPRSGAVNAQYSSPRTDAAEQIFVF